MIPPTPRRLPTPLVLPLVLLLSSSPALAEAAAAPGAKRAAPPAQSPIAELKRSNAQLKKVLQSRGPSWSPERDVRNNEVRKIVGQFLDFEELARRALVKHWDKLTAKQRSEFVGTLRDLIERNYVSQIHGQANYDLTFDKEERTGDEAAVNATLTTSPKGKKKISMSLVYKMVLKGGRWVVYDVVTEDESLLENYRAEFNKIIAREGFDKLHERMRRKLVEKPK